MKTSSSVTSINLMCLGWGTAGGAATLGLSQACVSPTCSRVAGSWHPSTQGWLCQGSDAAGRSLRWAQAGLWLSAVCSPYILCSDSSGVWVCVTAPRLHVSREEETPSLPTPHGLRIR